MTGYSEEFIDYIKSASNPDLFGLCNDGRCYPSLPPGGRRIGYGQPGFDTRFNEHGWPVEEADQKLVEELAARVDEF